jgi:hypothetical protein
MTWVNLGASFSYGATLTSTQMQNLRDNIAAMANGDSGAPLVQEAAIATGAVTENKIGSGAVTSGKLGSGAALANIGAGGLTSGYLGSGAALANIGTGGMDGSTYLTDATVSNAKLKTSTGSTSGTLAPAAYILIAMQDYCFFPNIGGANNYVLPYSYGSSDYIGRFGIYNGTGGNQNYSAFWRYVTASDKPFIYAIKDKDGKVLHVWECDDPPPGYWGMDSKPEGFIPPIIAMDADKQIIVPAAEIVAFNVNKEFISEVKAQAHTDKTAFASVLDKYDFNGTIFTSKNLSQI